MVGFFSFLYEHNRLIISGSDDLSYYHTLEIIIDTPCYISGVMDWSCDLNEEFIKLSSCTDNAREMLVLEFYSEFELKFKVIAKKISINFDTVFLLQKRKFEDW